MLGGDVELVEQADARGTRPLRERQARRGAGVGAGPVVARVAREHEAVDHERVLARGEQVGQPQLDGTAVSASTPEDVVLGDDAARRQSTPGSGHRLGRPAQLHLLLEQPVAG